MKRCVEIRVAIYKGMDGLMAICEMGDHSACVRTFYLLPHSDPRRHRQPLFLSISLRVLLEEKKLQSSLNKTKPHILPHIKGAFLEIVGQTAPRGMMCSSRRLMATARNRRLPLCDPRCFYAKAFSSSFFFVSGTAT